MKEAKDAVAIQQPGQRGPYKFYLAPGARAEREDPAGGRYVVDFDPRGRAIRHTDELNRMVVSEYDGRGRVVSRTWPEGDRTEFKYGLRDNVTELRRKAKAGTGLADLVITAGWHANWTKPEWIKDAKNLQTTHTYATNGNRLTTTQAAGTSMASTTTFGYDAVGNLTSKAKQR